MQLPFTIEPISNQTKSNRKTIRTTSLLFSSSSETRHAMFTNLLIAIDHLTIVTDEIGPKILPLRIRKVSPSGAPALPCLSRGRNVSPSGAPAPPCLSLGRNVSPSGAPALPCLSRARKVSPSGAPAPPCRSRGRNVSPKGAPAPPCLSLGRKVSPSGAPSTPEGALDNTFRENEEHTISISECFSKRCAV